MRRRLEGRVAVVTGAGRGLGRAHALCLAAEGAAVIVNDLGVATDGSGQSAEPASEVVELINSSGGRAVRSNHDVADWTQAGEIVRLAKDAFGRLDVVVNNAGILRDRAFANMEEAEWDAVIAVHLKGHAALSRHALAHWRDRAKAGETLDASIVHTSSIAGYLGNFGQANYASAKLAIVALSRVVAIEGSRYGVRSNVVSPSARTRMMGAAAAPASGFDARDPANVSPLVAWLAAPDCPANAQFFHVYGSRLLVLTLPMVAHDLFNPEGRWTLDDLDRELAGKLVVHPTTDEVLNDLRSRQAE